MSAGQAPHGRRKITAMPNAFAALEQIGMEKAWHDLAMKLHKRIEKKHPDRNGMISAPHEVTFFKGLQDHFGKGTWTEITYDFHARCFTAEIRGQDWRVRETEIVFHDLPETVRSSMTGAGVSRIIGLPHLAQRTIASMKRRHTKRWKIRFQMDEPCPIPVGDNAAYDQKGKS